jgi:hypothetical protein
VMAETSGLLKTVSGCRGAVGLVDAARSTDRNS